MRLHLGHRATALNVPHVDAPAAGKRQSRVRAVSGWWDSYVGQMRSAPGELILAIGITLWAVLLWLPVQSFGEGSAFRRLDEHIGGEMALAAITTVLAVTAWAGLLLDRWPPRWRCWTTYAQACWWLFVTIDAGLTRPQSPAWATSLMAMMLAYYVSRRLRRERARALFAAEVIAGSEPR